MGNRSFKKKGSVLPLLVFTLIWLIMLWLLAGCTATPVPNINIGGSKLAEDGTCIPQNVTITIVNGNDKATLGDESNINDDDSGLQDPRLDVGL